MNKLDRIKNLENELAELKADIIKDNEVVAWNPSEGEHFIDSVGNVKHTLAPIASGTIYNGMTFETSDQAQQAAIAYRRYHRLYRLALELNGDWVIDLSSNSKQSKWCIVYQDNALEVAFTTIACNPTTIYFKSRTLAQKAIDILGDELL